MKKETWRNEDVDMLMVKGLDCTDFHIIPPAGVYNRDICKSGAAEMTAHSFQERFSMKHIFLALSALLLLILPLAACKSAQPTPEGKLVVVEPAIKPTTTSMQVGDTLEVRLPTIPKEGFSWRVQDLDSKILKQDGEAVYVADDSANAAGGTTTLRFKALKAGSSTLTLIFAGSVDGSPEMSAQSFGVSVEVLAGD